MSSAIHHRNLTTTDIKPPRQREIVCGRCKNVFMSSLLGVAYCPNCHNAIKLEPGFSPTR